GADKPQLREIAGQYRGCARLWSELASAALPDSAKLFKDTKELLLKKSSIFKRGAPAQDELREAAGALRALEAEAAEDFPLNEAQTKELLAGLRSRIEEVYKAEVDALGALELVVA